MNCAYHSYNPANVNCNGCGKPLCPACDHRIKGFPYCQDCIVQGVQLLKNQRDTGSYSNFVGSSTSPFLAFILSFCPGLGAAYNGQTLKALVHFGATVGLLQLMVQSGMAIFFFAFLGMWFFSAVDAWKTARMMRNGMVPDGAENLLIHRFSGNLKIWAVVLVVIGVASFFDVRFLMRGLLPVLLIGLGFYILRGILFKSDSSDKYEPAREPVALVTAASEYRGERFDSANRRESRSWRNP